MDRARKIDIGHRSGGGSCICYSLTLKNELSPKFHILQIALPAHDHLHDRFLVRLCSMLPRVHLRVILRAIGILHLNAHCCRRAVISIAEDL